MTTTPQTAPTPGDYQRVLGLAIPIVLANLTQPVLSMVDTGIAGHFAEVAPLGGVALGGLIFSFIFWAFGFLRMGTTGLVAQAFGARDEIGLRNALWRAGLLALVIGAIIVLFEGPLIRISSSLLTDRPELIEQASIYCSARIWSAPLALSNYVILGYLLGVQRVRAALVLQVLVNVVNAAAAVVLVYGMHRGIGGLGAATASADAFGFCGGVFAIWLGGRALLKPPGRAELLNWLELRRLLMLNLNLFGRTMCLLAVFGWFTRASALLSLAALAANTVLLNFQTFMAYGLDGFANASEALVGEAIGAKDRPGLILAIRSSTLLAALVALAFCVVYELAGAWLISLLTDLPSVRMEAIMFLPFAALSPILSVWSFQLDGIFIGATKTRELLFGMVFSSSCFAIALIGLKGYGNVGLWIAFLVFMVARGASLAALLPTVMRAADTHSR